jgi:cell division protein FtsB
MVRREGEAMKTTRRPQRRAARRRTNRTRTQNRNRVLLTQTSRNDHLSMFLAGLVVVILMIAVSVNAMSLNRRLGENRRRAVQLKKEIQTEEQRAADIEEYRRYTSTDAYIEEIAREKLGLIYEGETVFKEDK